jgi:hypothetical protein
LKHPLPCRASHLQDQDADPHNLESPTAGFGVLRDDNGQRCKMAESMTNVPVMLKLKPVDGCAKLGSNIIRTNNSSNEYRLLLAYRALVTLGDGTTFEVTIGDDKLVARCLLPKQGYMDLAAFIRDGYRPSDIDRYWADRVLPVRASQRKCARDRRLHRTRTQQPRQHAHTRGPACVP